MNIRSIVLLTCLLGALGLPASAMAYIGPGSGISAIGVFIALIAGLILAIMGFVWYPIKRLVKKIKRTPKSSKESAE